jgi:hypothetical protein
MYVVCMLLEVGVGEKVLVVREFGGVWCVARQDFVRSQLEVCLGQDPLRIESASFTWLFLHVDGRGSEVLKSLRVSVAIEGVKA